MLRVKHHVPCETPHTDETEEVLRTRLAQDGVRLQAQTTGRRRLVKHGGKLCSRCLTNPPIDGQRYCDKCHAIASREYRERVKAKHAAIRDRLAAYEGVAP